MPTEPRRRSPLRSRRPGPGRWMPLVLLFLSLGVAAAAIHQAQRAVHSHRASAEGLLRDYASFAAWSFRLYASHQLLCPLERALGPVTHPRPGREGSAVTPAGLLAANRSPDTAPVCPRPAYPAPYFFRVPLDGGAPAFAGDVPGPAVRAWIAAAVRAHADAVFRPEWEVALAAGRVEGGERLLAYTVAGGADGERAAYGFEYQPERHAELFREVLDEDPLLPPALMDGRSNADLLAVQLLSPAGRVVFDSGAGEGWALASVDSLDPEYGGIRVRAAVRPEVAGSLVIGGLPRSRLPFLAGLLALACGLSVVAVGQLRREGELARLRSDFVASVSHELRTPLAKVRLFLETLRLGRYRTDEQREWILDNLDRETTRLTGLVDNVLHFARAERGAVGGDREAVPLAEYLERVVADFAPLAASRRVGFETRFEPGLYAALHADSFRQVVLNLLDNAVKYGPQGQTVRVGAALADGRVRITVDDEGPGIDPRERARVWEPFRRGERAIGSVAVGSGIGLSVVREIVEWHGGTARVENAPGGGARVVLELPGWKASGEAAGSAADAAREAV